MKTGEEVECGERGREWSKVGTSEKLRNVYAVRSPENLYDKEDELIERVVKNIPTE